jgi:predicted N-acyltransferase
VILPLMDSDQTAPLVARLLAGVGQCPATTWDVLTDGANPFVSHAFLTALEDSASVDAASSRVPRSGWQATPLVVEREDGEVVAALPAYIKAHSQGEYVFDHAWADAWHRAGGDYYPKLQIAVPFTPATGPRILTREPALAPAILRAAQDICVQAGLSSAHATFIAPDQVPLFEAAGWLIRHDLQFHWENRNYATFDDFLAALSSDKRKNLRKERRAAQEGVEIRHLTGDAILPEHWDAFWAFYQDTGARKWGQPYLTRKAFTLLGERMAERILLIMAFVDGQPVAGALNFIGGDTLYGRYWGALIDKPFLHFELCYYQAIDAALAMGLARVEAGAQGPHKLARGYTPVRTTSAHYIVHAGFRAAVADFLQREADGLETNELILAARAPYRQPS